MKTDSIIGARSGVQPVKLFDPDLEDSPTGHPQFAELRRWARDYLCRPHPDLGRHGPVCPYTSHAIVHRYLWAACFDGRDIDIGRITAIIDDLYDLFPALPPREPPEAQFKAVLSVFPDLTDYACLDTVQQELKTKFVNDGLMLGQFYPGCTYPGLHNPAFPALDAPLPMLAVRHMAPTDYPFLVGRHEWIDTYLKLFAPTIPGFVAASMSARLEQPTQPPASPR